MKTQEIIDYAYPCMMAERGLKKAHDALLDNDYDAAIEHNLAAIIEAKMMYKYIKIMVVIRNDLPDQTSSV